jgi:MFS family permease
LDDRVSSVWHFTRISRRRIDSTAVRVILPTRRQKGRVDRRFPNELPAIAPPTKRQWPTNEAIAMSMNNESPPKPLGRGSLLIIFLTVFIDLLGFGLVLPLLPVYADQFVIDPQGWQLGLLMASFSLMQFLVAPIWGGLSDRIGRRPVLIVGLAGSVIFYLIFAYATIIQSIGWLFVSRIGAGIAGATIPTAQAYIADCTSPEQRTRGMALIGMAFGLGFTFGPLIGFLAMPSGHGLPGPWPGYFAACLSFTALLGAVFVLPESLHRGSNFAHRSLLPSEGFSIIRHSTALKFLFVAIFVCVFPFSKFETTLSLLVKGSDDLEQVPFHFTWKQLCGTYALIGLTLAVIQGGVVRPISKRVSERILALVGVALESVGFLVLIGAIRLASVPLLFVGLLVIVAGFSFMQPSVNALVSRHTDPRHQGVVLGFSQSVNALGRILGSAIAIVLLKISLSLPYIVSAALLLLTGFLIYRACRIPFPASNSKNKPAVS